MAVLFSRAGPVAVDGHLKSTDRGCAVFTPAEKKVADAQRRLLAEWEEDKSRRNLADSPFQAAPLNSSSPPKERESFSSMTVFTGEESFDEKRGEDSSSESSRSCCVIC